MKQVNNIFKMANRLNDQKPIDFESTIHYLLQLRCSSTGNKMLAPHKKGKSPPGCSQCPRTS